MHLVLAASAAPPLWSIAPFVLILLAIAFLPLATPHWWEHNRNKAIISAALGIPAALYLGLAQNHDIVTLKDGKTHAGHVRESPDAWELEHEGATQKFAKADVRNVDLHVGPHKLVHTAKEYVAFIVLLAALFVISGGIYLRGSLTGTPVVNTMFLAIGAVIASFIGTTGASMVLIRPLLRANEKRRRKAHIVIFFIFIVSNIGGCLTPLGDPPLFLGFLRGVPFLWTFMLWKQWLVLNVVLLILFNIIDQIVFNKEERERPGSQLEEVQQVKEPLALVGKVNILLLLGVVGVIYGVGQYGDHISENDDVQLAVQVGGMLALLGASLPITPKAARTGNKFTWAPIIEVAVLFAGIFATMIPALMILEIRGSELPITQPWHYFWATGMLSSFLDNAPTYLTFTSAAVGQIGDPARGLEQLLETPHGTRLLTAISLGAVFMGANTYIGNGPNFMVKAIAEESGVKMPSFVGYMRWSVSILIPLFVVITFLFFR